MKNNRGYDDTKNLLTMATGLADGTYSSVHQAARLVLNETGGPNVDRLRRKFRELQRSNGFDEISRHEADFDPSEWWKPRFSDTAWVAKTTVQNVLVFVRNPANAFRKSLRASHPGPLVFLLMAMVMITVPGARLAFDIFTGVQTGVLPATFLGVFFAAISINMSAVLASEDAALRETQ